MNTPPEAMKIVLGYLGDFLGFETGRDWNLIRKHILRNTKWVSNFPDIDDMSEQQLQTLKDFKAEELSLERISKTNAGVSGLAKLMFDLCEYAMATWGRQPPIAEEMKR